MVEDIMRGDYVENADGYLGYVKEVYKEKGKVLVKWFSNYEDPYAPPVEEIVDLNSVYPVRK